MPPIFNPYITPEQEAMLREHMRRGQEYQRYLRDLEQAQPPFYVYQQVQNVPVPYGQFIAPPELVSVPESKPVEETVKVINPFLVGCDPEFIVLNQGKHQNMNGMFQKAGPIGWDHQGDVLEVRPAPAKSVCTLLRHIKDILFQTKSLSSYKLRAGAFYQTDARLIGLGGHIHLDVPYRDLDGYGVDKNIPHRIAALDSVTKLLEQLDILPRNESLKRRAAFVGNNEGNKYGSYGDARSADTANRLEYRTMASWLFSPISTLCCLTAGKLACAEPKATITELSTGRVSSGKLIRFFERFADDHDAKLVIEKLLEPGIKLQRDPDMNILEVWEKELNSELREV